MPFRSMAEIRDIRTTDVDQATAFMANNIRPGSVRKSGTGTEIRFRGDYFAANDFMVGEIGCGAGWSFHPEAELDAVLVWLGIEGEVMIRHDSVAGSASCEQVLVASARSTRQIVLDQPFHGIGIAACSTAVRHELEGFLGHNVGAPFDFLIGLDARSRSGSALIAFGAAVHAALTGGLAQTSPIGQRQFRDAFINLTLAAVGVEEMARVTGPPRSGSHAELTRAEDYMRAHAGQPIGISDVADHVGVSTRTLQYMFRRIRGTTPLATLLSHRLDGVRRDLLADDGLLIAEIAAKWGFTHPGRLSQQYQAAFGERASETAQRAGQAGRVKDPTAHRLRDSTTVRSMKKILRKTQ